MQTGTPSTDELRVTSTAGGSSPGQVLSHLRPYRPRGPVKNSGCFLPPYFVRKETQTPRARLANFV